MYRYIVMWPLLTVETASSCYHLRWNWVLANELNWNHHDYGLFVYIVGGTEGQERESSCGHEVLQVRCCVLYSVGYLVQPCTCIVHVRVNIAGNERILCTLLLILLMCVCVCVCRRLARLLKIIVPGVLTPEVGYLLLVAAMLVVRTYCDVWMIQNGTAIEGYSGYFYM